MLHRVVACALGFAPLLVAGGAWAEPVEPVEFVGIVDVDGDGDRDADDVVTLEGRRVALLPLDVGPGVEPGIATAVDEQVVRSLATFSSFEVVRPTTAEEACGTGCAVDIALRARAGVIMGVLVERHDAGHTVTFTTVDFRTGQAASPISTQAFFGGHGRAMIVAVQDGARVAVGQDVVGDLTPETRTGLLIAAGAGLVAGVGGATTAILIQGAHADASGAVGDDAGFARDVALFVAAAGGLTALISGVAYVALGVPTP